MSSNGPTQPGGDAGYRQYVSYIDKSREYYAAHGYGKPYRWATNTEAPFTPLQKPLRESRIAIVTTSGIHQDDKPADAPPPLPKKAFAAPTSPAPRRMFTDDLSWDKKATHTNDVETYIPLTRLQTLVDEGRLGSVADRFYGVPTEYSQRKTGLDAAQIEQWCREDGVDVVLLIPL